MDVAPVLSASLFIGSSIFLYIVALFVVLGISAYLVYRVSPKGKKRREERLRRREEHRRD